MSVAVAMRWRQGAASVVVAVLGALIPGLALAQAQTPVPAATDSEMSEPLEQVPLARVGYADSTLRGRYVSAEYFVPGPGDFLVSADAELALEIAPSRLLGPGSVMNVLWNGIPVYDAEIGDATVGATAGPSERVTLSIRVPRDRVEPDINRIQVQATLMFALEVCGDDQNPGRHVTIFNTSRVSYTYADRQPRPRAVAPDLARYPAPLLQSGVPRSAAIRFIVPAQPTSAEWTALARIAAYLGQSASARGARMAVSRDGDLGADGLARDHLVLVGRRDFLPSLAALPPPSAIRRAEDGTVLGPDGAALPAGTGVVLEAASPWNPARMVLAATGEDDVAVERAATVLAGRAGVRTLRGDGALISEASLPPRDALAPPGSVRLADLGRSDESVRGVGEHSRSFSLETSGVGGRTGLPLDLVISHSPLLDRARSSVRVVLNGVPLTSVMLKDLAPARGTTRVELPAASLKPGANVVVVEFSLNLGRYGDDAAGALFCTYLPIEQAWAVLHADSAFQPVPTTDSAAGADAISLASFPFPFVRDGALDQSVVVVPDDLAADPSGSMSLVRFAADLGRGARADVLMPVVVPASAFDPATHARDRDVVLFGLPEQNPVLAQLGERLPIQVDAGSRLVLARDLTVAVRDTARLGVVQQVVSPWSPDRTVLVVTGTGPEGLPLAVEALRQGNLAGNAALASRQEAQPPVPGRTPTPEPLALGAPRSEALQVSTFRLRPRLETSVEAGPRRWPIVPAVAAVAAAITMLVAGALAYQAYAARRARGG